MGRIVFTREVAEEIAPYFASKNHSLSTEQDKQGNSKLTINLKFALEGAFERSECALRERRTN